MIRTRRGSARGFTLLEVLIAVVILGFVAVGLARLLVTGSQRADDAGAVGYRTAALAAEVARVTAAPPGTLVDGTITRSVTTPPFLYTASTTVTTSGVTQTITITITPNGPRPIDPVTRIIQRITTCGANPFP
jgi:prepilin-type N-terminal cleavage/methylation domain-containing protein